MPNPPELTYFPTRRSSDLRLRRCVELQPRLPRRVWRQPTRLPDAKLTWAVGPASLPASPLRAGFLSALALARPERLPEAGSPPGWRTYTCPQIGHHPKTRCAIGWPG